MQQAFKQVWMVSEGMLDFPLSDLWKMGDHYMVTLMQERLVSHLWHYVVLLPPKGAPLHRFSGRGRTQGHFGFAGHNDPVEFREVSIQQLPGN